MKMKIERDKTKEIRRELFTPCELRLREAEDGTESREIEGYAILFNTPSALLFKDDDSDGVEVIDPAAITRELLDLCDIKMTMFHNRYMLLARSCKGEGTLTYGVDEKGVWFRFSAPHTVDGDKAIELVKRGDLAGCSFAFTTHYWDDDFVTRTVTLGADGTSHIVYTVRAVTGIYDFTITDNPAYPDTSVNMRELLDGPRETPEGPDTTKMREQVAEMRRLAEMKIY